MKGLVLSGGSGTRLRPLTHTRAKQLLPIVGSPILHHILNSLQDAGIKETVILNQAHHNIFDTNPEIDLIYNKIENFIKSN